ncbi:hypothetical protein PBI_LEMURIA_35 [Mycobacterium phage Lemuria]|uniref:Uncharacterized protein n=1 Tax=Mycobacterium phage Lemuria TaxID=2599868 RepID=A0A5J6THF1_9CAUD|nr:hypothetical protein KDW76_gp35 [Mycobacterium phage Lemuria]QFG10115.1 hypothetical protein PBI_LEMURIA_35 [Mycobacterium phage Lemuria]
MSDNNLRPIWTPADYEETLAEAAKHRAIPGAYEAQAALYAEAERVGRHRKPHVITADVEFGTKAHEMLLGIPRSKQEAEGAALIPVPVDEGRPLPYRRNPDAECPSCWAPAGDLCDPFCLSRMTPDEQIAHRNAVIETTIAELDAGDMHPDVPPWADGRHMLEKVAEYSAIDCTIAGRHRVRADPFRRVRRLRAVIAVAVLVLVLALAALWASSDAKAETFDVCPSGLSGVATPDTSCAFADSVRAAFYWQPSWTVIATSPVTGKFYTMQCGRTDTTGTGWYDSKRCFGVNDAGAVLVVYVA